MNRLILAVAVAAGHSLAATSPALAATKNYDCSKPGNANKAVCKGAAKDAAKAAAKPAPVAKTVPARAAAVAKPAATKVSSTTTAKTVTEKNYDCSKPGNKNRAVCKSAAVSPAKPFVKQVTAATQTRHYDCANAGKQECKVSTTAKQMASKPVAQAKVKAAPAPKPRPAATPRRTAAATPASVEDHNPSGAAAQCKDGTYSHSKTRIGACSRHGGVAKWM
jgi:Protein of unknown function (DUF3761)